MAISPILLRHRLALPVLSLSTRLVVTCCRSSHVLHVSGDEILGDATVMLLDLTPAAQVQGSLFETPDDPTSKARMVALDTIHRKFAKGALVYGIAGLKREWDMRRGYMSKADSTS